MFHPFCREAPHGRICMKFCTGGRLADVISCAKFYLNQVRGFDYVGVEFLRATASTGRYC